MIDFESLPYAKWLEEANKALVDINPDAIYFGMIKNGEVISSYYDVGEPERALIIQEMLMLSLMERSEERIRQLIDEYMEEQEDDEEECEDT